VLEARARALSVQLRCMVCQNQSIDDSDADLARDLRVLVRERLTLGDSDDDVLNFVVARYGDFVLLQPPFNASTLLLWATPAAALIVGMAVMWRRGRRRVTAESLSVAEERALEVMLARIDSDGSQPAPTENNKPAIDGERDSS